MKKEVRLFPSGATRDTASGKIDPEGFLSPIVIQRYSEYMDKNRIQADGKVRESDNWQKLFGENHAEVCMKSAWRHFLDVWLQHRGFKGRDTLEDSICACMFNLQAYLYKLLLEKHDRD